MKCRLVVLDYIAFKGELPEQRKKKRSDLDIELYDNARFMTVTGESIGQSEICDEQEILNNLVERFFKEEQNFETTLTYDPNHKSELSDEEVINLMLKSKQKTRLVTYWRVTMKIILIVLVKQCKAYCIT